MYAFGARISQERRARRESSPQALGFEDRDDSTRSVFDGSKLLEGKLLEGGQFNQDEVPSRSIRGRVAGVSSHFLGGCA